MKTIFFSKHRITLLISTIKNYFTLMEYESMKRLKPLQFRCHAIAIKRNIKNTNTNIPKQYSNTTIVK